METDLEDETPEDEYLRVNCPRIFDVRNIIDAIANKWSNVVYPYKNQENTNKLYKVFDTLLKTLGGGKCAEFILGFLDGRLRQVLKAAVAQALSVDSLAPFRALLDEPISNQEHGQVYRGRVCLWGIYRQDRSENADGCRSGSPRIQQA